MKASPTPSGPTSATAPVAVIEPPDPGRWRSLAVILAAAFLAGFDFFVVNVSIPSIRADLHATFMIDRSLSSASQTRMVPLILHRTLINWRERQAWNY